MPKHSMKGVSDILGIIKRTTIVSGVVVEYGAFLAIEVKKPVKKTRTDDRLFALATPEQKAFLNQVNHLGGIGFVADSLEVVRRHLKI
jgi:hypothetical protein